MTDGAAGPARLQESPQPLYERYDCAMLDLDGVVYRGPNAIPDVPYLLRQARRGGMTQAFVTNNAARTPDAVAKHLRDLGVEADASDVVTSAQAAARELVALVGLGAPVFVVGGEGLTAALREVGLRPVSDADERPAAVVQGFHPDVGWRQLAKASYLVAQGVPWVATNLDLTVPTARGIAPGNGALVAAVAAAGGRRPDLVAGKPYRPLFDETVRRTGATHPLVVGDRLDTDIEGAVGSGADSLLVMTGVTDLAALCSAVTGQRPSYVSWTLAGLLTTHETPVRRDGSWHLDGWSVAASATASAPALVLEQTGDDRDSGLRTVVSAAWEHHDTRPAGSKAPPLDVSTAVQALAACETCRHPAHG